MEEMHRTHKDTAWGWVAAMDSWRHSRTRQRLRRNRGAVGPWNTRIFPDWSV